MLVIDATHPYATEASVNIKAACRDAGMEYIRVLRERCAAENCFPSLDALIEELKSTEGQIFVTLGAKAAMKLTELPDYQNRLWLRILPSADGLNTCLDLGYPARRLICMQGPFSTELNIAMLRQTGAKALVTKESGDIGGFIEKLTAAREMGVETFILGRPADTDGVHLDAVFERVMKL